MDTYGWLSILPPVVAIAIAIKSRQVYLSLGLFVWLGWTIMSSWNPITGLIRSVDAFVEQVTSADNARVLMFSSLIGAMITMSQASGGTEGFVGWIDRRGLARSKRSVGLLTVVVRPWAKFFPGFLAMAWVNMGPYPFSIYWRQP